MSGLVFSIVGTGSEGHGLCDLFSFFMPGKRPIAFGPEPKRIHKPDIPQSSTADLDC